jgi:hypothetical protein
MNTATLTEIRKQLDGDNCTDTRKTLTMFAKICKTNPGAVYAVMGKWAQERQDLGGTSMIDWYRENAEYLATLFDYQ